MGQKWFYSDNGQEAGPFSLDQLKWLVANKRISPDDLVWSEGMPDWVRAAEIGDLFSADKAIRIKPPPLPKSASAVQAVAIVPQQQVPMASASQPPAPMQSKPASRSATKAPSAQSSASSGIGTVTVCRKPKLTGFLYAVKVLADGQPVGEIPGGVLDLLAGRERELEFHLPSGRHSIEVAGGGLKGSVTVNVPTDRDVSLATFFSNLGALGGGLVVVEDGASPQEVRVKMPQAVPAPQTVPPLRAALPPQAALQMQSAPALWNPFAVRAWSLLLTWAFGSLLTSKNWISLGEDEKAKRSMRWFYAGLVFLAAVVVLPSNPVINALLRLIGVGGFIAWSILDSFPQAKCIKERFGKQYPRQRWLKPLGIGAACFLCVLILGSMVEMTSAGSITFAEHVDRVTFKTQNEGTTFTTGLVAMVVRGNEPFGDSRLVITYRKAGEDMWLVLETETVDPNWDIFAVPIYLETPGNYSIAVKTGKGRLVAQNDVEILP